VRSRARPGSPGAIGTRTIRVPMPNETPTVNGIVEAALYVEQVARSMDFYRDLFGFEEELRAEAIGVLRVPGRQALILFPRTIVQAPAITPPLATEGTIPPHGGSGRMHVAFSIRPGDLDPWRKRLAERGIAIEGTVRWKRGGTSLSFRDPDQHLIELLTPGLWSFY
jgi:catechol 2,3-dioxygenase-like lactoylglutathione lyase family enzyme